MARTNPLTKFLHGIGEMITPVLASSKFVEKGVITPEEFVAAGDLLCARNPSWSWQQGDASCRKSSLPDGKQFLITRGVPSLQRVSGLADAVSDRDTGDGWVETTFSSDAAVERAGAPSAGSAGQDSAKAAGTEGSGDAARSADAGGASGDKTE